MGRFVCLVNKNREYAYIGGLGGVKISLICNIIGITICRENKKTLLVGGICFGFLGEN